MTLKLRLLCCFSNNIEPNNKGFSPFQIVYGTNPNIPGIINSTPTSLSSDFASQDVRKHMTRLNTAREAFRIADNDERIKRAFKSKLSKANAKFNIRKANKSIVD